MNLVVGRLTCNPAGFGFVVPERPGKGQARRRLRLRRQHQGSAARRPRGGAHRAHDPQGRRGPHHPRPRARPCSAWSAATRTTAASAATSCPSTAACSTSCSSPPARRGGAQAGRDGRAEITRPPIGHPQPRRPRPRGAGAARGPGRRPQGRHGQVRPARRVPGRGRGGGRARARRGRAPRTSPAAPTSAPGPPSPSTPRPPATTTTRSASTGCRTATGSWPCTSPTWPTTCGRAPPSTRRPTCAAPRSTSRTASCPCCRTRSRSNICSLVDGQDRLTQTRGARAGRQGPGEEARVPRRRHPERRPHELPAGAEDRGRRRRRCASGSRALVPLFERMDELAKLMRKRRYERGSLDFDLPEPKLVLDAAGEMTGIVATRAPRQHARDRGVHAGRQRGGGRARSRSRRGRALPHPRAARPAAGRGVLRPRGLVRLPHAHEPRGDPAPRTSSSSCARSRASPRRSSSPTCCCAP